MISCAVAHSLQSLTVLWRQRHLVLLRNEDVVVLVCQRLRRWHALAVFDVRAIGTTNRAHSTRQHVCRAFLLARSAQCASCLPPASGVFPSGDNRQPSPRQTLTSDAAKARHFAPSATLERRAIRLRLPAAETTVGRRDGRVGRRHVAEAKHVEISVLVVSVRLMIEAGGAKCSLGNLCPPIFSVFFQGN